MTEELEQLLKNLKLRRMLEIYDEQLRAADKDDISYSEFVTRLVRAQYQARQEGALEWRIRRANLPERWSLETFPFARQPGVNRKQIRGFAELEFITKAENIVLVGETGRGKTGLACSLLLKALENGYRCQFVKAQDLFDEMYASLVAPFLRGVKAGCVKAVPCLYTATAGFRFLIDRHPRMDRVMVVSACSGHGFKHSADIGETAAGLAFQNV
jgi:ABC-type glutathione transport system ATPase component